MAPQYNLRKPANKRCTPLHVGLQDYSCVVVADAKGLRIFSLDTRQVCYQIGVGAVSAAEMLFSTSLLAFVGSGESSALTNV